MSGRGSNLQALIDAQGRGELGGGRIAIVFSNVESAPGLERARRAGIPVAFRDHRGRAREAFDAEVADILMAHSVELVCLAGYMRLLSPGFVQQFPNRILNIHPSLLPKFPGVRVHEQVLAAGETESGATVHFLTAELDAGPVIGQAKVPVLPGDTVETLSARVLEAEHTLYPEALRLVAEGRVRFPANP